MKRSLWFLVGIACGAAIASAVVVGLDLTKEESAEDLEDKMSKRAEELDRRSAELSEK